MFGLCLIVVNFIFFILTDCFIADHCDGKNTDHTKAEAAEHVVHAEAGSFKGKKRDLGCGPCAEEDQNIEDTASFL